MKSAKIDRKWEGRKSCGLTDWWTKLPVNPLLMPRAVVFVGFRGDAAGSCGIFDSFHNVRCTENRLESVCKGIFVPPKKRARPP